MAGVLVSIVIPVFNHLDLTKQCLDSIAENTDVPYEVIMVDNASTDGTGAFLASRPVRVITNAENRGFQGAANQGIRAATGEYICLLNNDVIVLPGWLEPLLQCLREDPKVGIAGPMQVSPQGMVWHAGTVFGSQDDPVRPRMPFHIFKDFPGDDPAVNIKRSYPAMNFACAITPRKLFDEIGLPDEDTFMFPGFFEDVDWCLRLRKAGYLCTYCPQSRVIHLGNQTYYGDNLKNQSLLALEKNLIILLDKWKEEPEFFLLPPKIQPVLDEYYESKVFIMEEAKLLKHELARSKEYLNELENELAKASGVNEEATHYARKLERELQRKNDALEDASRSVARVGRELEMKNELSISLSGELEAARAQIGELEAALSRKLTTRLLEFLRRRVRIRKGSSPGAP
jgi:GT2 family glycosyltransferase